MHSHVVHGHMHMQLIMHDHARLHDDGHVYIYTAALGVFVYVVRG